MTDEIMDINQYLSVLTDNEQLADFFKQVAACFDTDRQVVVMEAVTQLATNTKVLRAVIGGLKAALDKAQEDTRFYIRNGGVMERQRQSMNVQSAWDFTPEEAQIALDLVAGQLPDHVWSIFRGEFETALRHIVDDVQADREEQDAPVDEYGYQGVG